MVDKRNKSFIVSSLVTLSVIAMLIASVPAGAVTVSISGLSGSITQGSPKTFLVTVTIDSPDKFVPVSNITLSINGPTTKQWTFNPTSGMLINQPDDNITIKVVSSPNTGHFGLGYGYGVDTAGYGYGYDFGYGYGYGYNSGQGGRPISFTYEITLSTTNLTEGDYTATAYLNTGNPAKASFASADASFTIVPGNIQDKGSISGFKVNDTNGNSVWNPGETGIEDWNIMLLDDKGTQIATTSTNASGFYQFTNLTPGIYNVTEETKPGFTPTRATSRVITIENDDVTDVNFLNQVEVTPPTKANTISGFTINDLNDNGRWDTDEAGLADWNIRLVGIGVGTIGINKETTTDDRGFYSFNNLTAGSYVIIETLKDGFVPTSAPVKAVIVAEGGSSMNNNFTNRPI